MNDKMNDKMTETKNPTDVVIEEEESDNTTMNDFALFLEELKEADPDMGELLDDMLENYDVLLNREVRKKQSQKKAIKKYFLSERGKIKNREANKRYYYRNKTTTKPVGRPKKQLENN